MKKLVFAVAVLVAGVALADWTYSDLTVDAGESRTIDAANPFNDLVAHLTVNGTLTIDGVKLTNGVPKEVGTPSFAIGNDPAATAPALMYLKAQTHSSFLTSANIIIGANGGKGGQLFVTQETAGTPGSWSYVNLTAIGLDNNYGGHYGTLGNLSAKLTLSASVAADAGVEQTDGSRILDIAKLGKNASLSVSEVANNSTAVKARVLFDGGQLWRFVGGVTESPVAGAELIFEGVNGKNIILREYNGTFGVSSGTLTLQGNCGVELYNTDGDWSLYKIGKSGGTINWRQTGDLILRGTKNAQMALANVLPYGKQTGRILLKESGSAAKPCRLDLNGKDQKINGLVSAGTSVCLTNSSATVATLTFGTDDTDGVVDFAAALGDSTIAFKKVGTGRLTVSNVVRLASLTVEAGALVLPKKMKFGHLTVKSGASVLADGCILKLADLVDAPENLVFEEGARVGGLNGGVCYHTDVIETDVGEHSKDVVVPDGTELVYTAPQRILRQVIVNGDFKVDGTTVTNTALEGAAMLAIGNDATAEAPANFTVTNALGNYIGGYVTKLGAKIGANGGKGGTITLHGKNPKSYGWGTGSFDWGNGMGAEYDGYSGTFGSWGATVTLDASVQDPGEGVMDILNLGKNSCFAGSYIYNNSTAVKARILFDGGALWRLGTGVSLSPVAGAEIVLESVGGKDIEIRAATGGGLKNSGAGTVRTVGAGAVFFGGGDGPRPTAYLDKTRVIWEHTGGFKLADRKRYVLSSTDYFAYGAGFGDVTIGPGSGAVGDQQTLLDLNGKDIHVNGLVFANYSILSNSVNNTPKVTFGAGDGDGVLDAGKGKIVGGVSYAFSKVGSGTLTVRNTTAFDNLTVEEGTLALQSVPKFGALTVKSGVTLAADGCAFNAATLADDPSKLDIEDGVIYTAVNGGMIVRNRDDGKVDVYVGSGSVDLTKVGAPIARVIKSSADGETTIVSGGNIAAVEVAAGTLRFATVGVTLAALFVEDGAQVVVDGVKVSLTGAKTGDGTVVCRNGGQFVTVIDGVAYPKFVTTVEGELNLADASFLKYVSPDDTAPTQVAGGLNGVIEAGGASGTIVKTGAGTLKVTSDISAFGGDIVVEAGTYYTDAANGIGGKTARLFIKAGATFSPDGRTQTIDLRQSGQVFVEGTGAADHGGLAIHIWQPKCAGWTVSSQSGLDVWKRYLGGAPLTLTGDATFGIDEELTDAGSAYHEPALGTVDFQGHTLSVLKVGGEMNLGMLVASNPGNIVIGSSVRLVTTTASAAFNAGSSANRLVRVGGSAYQIYGGSPASSVWTLAMTNHTFFQSFDMKTKTTPVWGGPLELDDATGLSVGKEFCNAWVVFTNVVTGPGGFYNALDVVDGTARTNVNLRLTNANNTFAGGVRLQSNSTLHLATNGALPKDGGDAVMYHAGIAFEDQANPYELPGCQMIGPTTVTGGTGLWTKPFVKSGDGILAYDSDVAFSSLSVQGGSIDFGDHDCTVGNLVLDGEALNETPVLLQTNGKLVFPAGAKLSFENESAFHSNRGAVTIAKAKGGIEGAPVVESVKKNRVYRLYADGEDVKLECQSGMLLFVR